MLLGIPTHGDGRGGTERSLNRCFRSLGSLGARPPFRPEICRADAGVSVFMNFFAFVPLRYLVVDCTPSLIANSSRTHSVDFLVSSPATFRSVFLKA
jgi:hypothetical protein